MILSGSLSFRKEIDPCNPFVRCGRVGAVRLARPVHVLQLLGRFAEAETIFRALIRRHPAEAELYRIFLATQKLPVGDPLIRAMEQLWARRDLPEGKRLLFSILGRWFLNCLARLPIGLRIDQEDIHGSFSWKDAAVMQLRWLSSS